MNDKHTEPIDRDSRDLLIEIKTSMDHLNKGMDTLNERVNKRESEIDDVRDDVNGIKNQIAGFRGQMIMLKIMGGVIGLILGGLEAYRLFNP